MKNIRNWYKLLEGSGLIANDSGPGGAHGTLDANITWCPYDFIYPPGLTLTGTLNPDATGLYILTGFYNNRIYLRNTSGYYLWWDSTNAFWIISTALGSLLPGYWFNFSSPTIPGTYDPDTYTGTGTLTGLTLQSFKGVINSTSLSRITSAAAANFNPDQGSIEMLFRPSWSYDDGLPHFFWNIFGGANKQFFLYKHTTNITVLYTGDILRGTFTYPWSANTLYHIVLNWGANTIYINNSLEHTFDAGGLGDGATNLYIGDTHLSANCALAANIYYFIVRDVPLTAAEITAFNAFFQKQYIQDLT